MKPLNYSFLILFFALQACNNPKQEQEALQKVVIDKHDVLMVQMDDIMNKKAKLDSLTANFKSILEKNPSTDTTALKLAITNLKADLTKADDAMMQWMHQFNPDHTGKSHEEIMSYLKNQEVKIDSVETLFKESLTKSDSLISKF